MSGHSKWAGIKHKKAIVDKRRGKLFTKLANAITIAAKEGKSGDLSANPRLRDAVERARAANMPMANIERAIDKGAGKGAEAFFEVVYEGYGPGGIAVMAEALTDNKNRSVGEIRAVFNKYGGKMGAPNSVAWMFDVRGVATLKGDNKDELMMKAIDAGAEDVDEGMEEVLAYTQPDKLGEVASKLKENAIEVSTSIEKIPKNTVLINDEKMAGQVITFMEALEDLDEVAATYANFDIPPEILEKVAL